MLSQLNSEPIPTERYEIAYKNESTPFLLSSYDFSNQFSHLYAYRLQEYTKLLKSQIKTQWGDEYPIKKLHELREENLEKCILIGTLFKHQIFKPSILRDVCEENQLAPQPPKRHFGDKSDYILLEDELQRVELVGKIEVHNLVTGIVVAVLGNIKDNGKFFVDDYVFYECGPQTKMLKLDQRPFLVIVSGLDYANSQKYGMALDMFQQWLTGNMSDVLGGRIVRIIVAGNSFRTAPHKNYSSLRARKFADSEASKSCVKLDEWFTCWSNSVHVDVMPGEFDPSNLMLPQQPMHHCLFPNAKKNSSFSLVTNPYSFRIGDRLVIGTSGQNLQNILKLSEIEKPMKALKSTLEWSHIAPTTPDTLPSYPYLDTDPFIIRECPHIYFAGNSDVYETELWMIAGKKTRLVCVPSFSKSLSAVAIDLNNLDCRSVNFNVSTN